MNTKILATVVFLATAGTVVAFPLFKRAAVVQAATIHHVEPKIEVVFALDTTSSMSGMISAAKEKIWSIATTLAQAQQTPEIRMGLVAFRDRGADSVYASLMGLAASGGGDGPESVNAALDNAIDAISWSQDPSVYRTVFLVGDAPPHMDYDGERQYPEILAAARKRGIKVNTVQSGQAGNTLEAWTRIAQLGGGEYLQVGQNGNAIAIETPFDAEIAELAASLDDTRIIYGTDQERAELEAKATDVGEVLATASVAAQARRGIFNSSDAGRVNVFGDRDLIEDIEAGKVAADELLADPERLPESFRAESAVGLQSRVSVMSAKREELRQRIDELATERDAYLADKIEEDEEATEASLDMQFYDVIRAQAAPLGIMYEQGPKL